MALFTFGYGAYVEVYAIVGANTLYWSGFDLDRASTFGWLCLIAAVIHAFGIWLNGAWRWSPLVRVVGLLFAAGLFMCLSWLGSSAVNTAGFMYMCVGVGFLAALQTAVRDSLVAIWGPPWTNSLSK